MGAKSGFPYALIQPAGTFPSVLSTWLPGMGHVSIATGGTDFAGGGRESLFWGVRIGTGELWLCSLECLSMAFLAAIGIFFRGQGINWFLQPPCPKPCNHLRLLIGADFWCQFLFASPGTSHNLASEMDSGVGQHSWLSIFLSENMLLTIFFFQFSNLENQGAEEQTHESETWKHISKGGKNILKFYSKAGRGLFCQVESFWMKISKYSGLTSPI